MAERVKNPILTGFNPDPSMIYADGSFYIATSTFEYFPGVQIHKSEDLVNWKVVARPIAADKIDMRSVPSSGGVWAPCLSYNDKEKLFYLVYSNLTSWNHGPFKDCANFIITTRDVAGEWSEPVYINSSGFDASLFHDDDGKKYFLNVKWDYRKPNGKEFEGIYLQEYDSKEQRLIGERHNIFKGTDRGLVEGPHIYKKDGYYYLFTAEGGTSISHAETVSRSKNITGPYELHPLKHIVTSFKTDNPMQKAGHASICFDDKGNCYMAHLIGRREVNGCCPLGRETAIQNIVWRDGWPYVAGDNQGNQPRTFFEIEGKVAKNSVNQYANQEGVIEFCKESLNLYFQSIRVGIGNKVKIIDANTLELTGGESIKSLAGQSALLVRQQDFKFSSQVEIDSVPKGYNHIAGLLYRYNEDNQYLFSMTRDEFTGKKCLTVMTADNGEFKYHPLDVYFDGNITLKLDVNYANGQFSFRTADGIYETKQGETKKCGKDFVHVWKVFDVSRLSDEYANPMGFTGAFVGMYAADFDDRSWKAKFRNFVYKGLK